MNSGFRLIAIFFVLGLCVSYALWGGAKPAPAEVLPPVTPSSLSAEKNKKGSATVEKNTARFELSKSIRMNPEKLDFGEMELKTRKTLSVAVENISGAALKIVVVQPSCGCLKAEMPVREIPAGGQALLNVTYFADGDRVSPNLSVTLTTDEPGELKAQVRVLGTVRRDFQVEPPMLMFGKVLKRTPKTLEAVIQNVRGKPFNIKGIQTVAKEFSFKWTPVEGSDNSAYTITATVQGAEGRRLTEEAAIVTDYSNIPANLSLYAEIIPDVTLTPNSLLGILGADKKIAPFEIVVKRTTPGEWKIEKVTEAEDWPISITIENIDESARKLRIQLEGEYKKSAFNGQFLIKTSVEEKPLPIAYFISAPLPKPVPAP
jgi:hypothetical protein